MKTSDFYYDLPEELIAQTPVEPRDHSRMLVVHRGDGKLEHKHFYDIVDYLNPGDALVINETKVIPARLLGVKEDTGVPVEVLLLRRVRFGPLDLGDLRRGEWLELSAEEIAQLKAL